MAQLTSIDRVLFPATGFSVRDLEHFYTQAAPLLLPHLAQRPVTLKRFPDDIKGETFWEKDLPAFAPKWVKTFPVPRVDASSDIHYINISNAKTLAWAASVGCVELHPFLHCYPSIQQPTSIVFDLDPGPPADIIHCCRVALLLRSFLAEYSLKALIKTSGLKGVQVYVPLNTAISYSTTQPFAKRVAESLAQAVPTLITSEMDKSLRRGRVFIDWSQNAPHKTTVAVYSVRAKWQRPFVSMPLGWDEVEHAIRTPDHKHLHFSPDQALDRMREFGDLFASNLKLKQQIPRKLLKAWNIEASIPASNVPSRDTPKPFPAATPPRSSRQGGRRLFVVHQNLRADWEYELALEDNEQFLCWQLGSTLPRKSKPVTATESGAQPLNYQAVRTAKNIVWDVGSYELVEGSLKKGAVRVHLSGRRISGELLLEQIRDKEWRIANSGLVVQDGEAGSSVLPPIEEPKPSPAKSRRLKAPQVNGVADLPRATPTFIKPMECTEVRNPESLPHDSRNWMYEVKWDGFRCELVKRKRNIQVFTRHGNEPNARFKHINDALVASALPDCVLDGELIALNDEGVPEFQLLQSSRKNDAKVVYVAFDVLNYNGADLTSVPLQQRKEILVSLRSVLPADAIMLSEPLDGNLDKILAVIKQKHLEGVVAKRRSSLYYPGRDKFEGWVKYRISEVDEFVIGGYMRQTDPVFDALVVGRYENGRLLYKEKIRFGFEGADKQAIIKRLQPLRIENCPFDNLPQRKRRGALDLAQMKQCVWVRPQLWCEMEFAAWTNDGEIRGHGRFRQIVGKIQKSA